MVFSSTIFLFIFLPVILAIYFILPKAFKNGLLLLASLLFYFWGEPKFGLILVVSILINYFFGLAINWANQKNRSLMIRRFILGIAVISNLSLLFWFKYFDFSITTVNDLFHSSIPLKNIALPIGISFFTFQAMTYIIDLYWKEVPVQKNPLKIALYISMFPKLVQGPIVRYKDIEPQIDNREITIYKFSCGIKRFVLGLGKKTIIANTVGLVADHIFNAPYNENRMITAWIGIICYTIQIYFDFSGYSDMAIGLGKMLGFDFMENFNYPYISKSISEFWRRWHISLSSFFRDYLYIPLGGNRTGNVYLNLFIVFLATGIWHGASWNFIVWGIWHGLFIIAERIAKNSHRKHIRIPSIIKWVYSTLVVMIGWVLFRAKDLNYAIGYLKIMFGLETPRHVGFESMYYLDALTIFVLVISFIVASGILVKIKNRFISAGARNEKIFTIGQTVGICLLFLICSISVMTSTYNPFIYFKF